MSVFTEFHATGNCRRRETCRFCSDTILLARVATLTLRFRMSIFLCIKFKCHRIDKLIIFYPQNIIYRLDDGSVLSEDRSVYDFNFGTVRESTTTQWKDHQFNIPVVPTSNLEGCSLIDIVYIMALVRVKSPSLPLVSTHITIGTIPSPGKKAPLKWKYSGNRFNVLIFFSWNDS